MGHYDDCYAEVDKREAEFQRRRQKEMAKEIQKDLDKMGLAKVLTKIVMKEYH